MHLTCSVLFKWMDFPHIYYFLFLFHTLVIIASIFIIFLIKNDWHNYEKKWWVYPGLYKYLHPTYLGGDRPTNRLTNDIMRPLTCSPSHMLYLIPYIVNPIVLIQCKIHDKNTQRWKTPLCTQREQVLPAPCITIKKQRFPVFVHQYNL